MGLGLCLPQVRTYEEPLVVKRGDAALRVLDVGAGCDLALPGLPHGHIVCGGAVDPGQRDALGLGMWQLVGHHAAGCACGGSALAGQWGHSPPVPHCRAPGRSQRRNWPRAFPRRALACGARTNFTLNLSWSGVAEHKCQGLPPLRNHVQQLGLGGSEVLDGLVAPLEDVDVL